MSNIFISRPLKAHKLTQQSKQLVCVSGLPQITTKNIFRQKTSSCDAFPLSLFIPNGSDHLSSSYTLKGVCVSVQSLTQLAICSLPGSYVKEVVGESF